MENDSSIPRPTRPLRVLHVVDTLGVGGIETWLVQMLERMDRAAVAIDVMVQQPGEHAYEARARATGARVLRCPRPDRPWRYARNFRRIVRRHGPYDVVHAHPHHWCGVVMRLAYQADVPMRIAHSRNDISTRVADVGPLRAAYYRLMKRWLWRYMTHGLAVSAAAGESLFGSRFHTDRRCGVMPSGIDLAPFEPPVDRAAVLAELEMPVDARVIGHVGRFVGQKNHLFLLEIFHDLARREARAHLLLVGDGPLRGDVERRIPELGLSDRVRLLGRRGDVARLMKGAFDVLVLPSMWEGLPRVVNEAQAAGVPAVIASHLAPELDIVPGLVERVDVSTPASTWARAIMRMMAADKPSKAEALDIMRRSPVNIERNRQWLEQLYRSGQLSR